MPYPPNNRALINGFMNEAPFPVNSHKCSFANAMSNSGFHINILGIWESTFGIFKTKSIMFQSQQTHDVVIQP